MIMFIAGRRQRPQRDDGRGIDHFGVFALCHGLVDCRLEALLIDHQIRRRQARDLSRGEFQVVRLGPWLGQAGDRGVVTGDTLGDELQRVERGHDVELTRLLRLDGGASRPGGSASGGMPPEAAGKQGGTSRASLTNMRTIFIKGLKEVK